MIKDIIEITKFVLGLGAFMFMMYAIYVLMWAMSPENGLGLY